MSDLTNEEKEYGCMVTATVCKEQNISKMIWIRCGVPSERAEEIWNMVQGEENGTINRTA